MILSQRTFSRNLGFKAWNVLQEGAGVILAGIGKELRDFYVNEQLQKRLGSFQPAMIVGHTCRQDFELPHPSGVDWTEQDQEEVYIHFLRLIAYAIDEGYQRIIADCVAPFNCDKKPFNHGGIKSIKGFTRMFNKMLSKADHRYSEKPRPGRR